MAEPAPFRRAQREWRALAHALHVRVGQAPQGFPASPIALFVQLEEGLHGLARLRRTGLDAVAGRYATPAWTVTDLVGHLASWAREFRAEVETAAEGREFEYAIPFALNVMGPNQWNAEHAAGQRGRPLPDLAAEFEAETRHLQDLVLALPPGVLYRPARFPLAPGGDPAERFTGTIAQIVLGKCLHDGHHLSRLGAVLARARRRP